MDNLSNPILITGASGGIGTALIDYLLTLGCTNLVCQYRANFTNLELVFNKHKLPFSKHCYSCDLTNEEAIYRMTEQISLSWEMPLKIINLAGSSSNKISWKIEKNEFEKVIEDNLLTSFLTSKAFIPEMRKCNRGKIINISSVVAFTGAFGACHYSAAKSGLIGLTKSLALELAPFEITVNAIALGYFNYGLINSIPESIQDEIRTKIPLKRFGDIESLGGLVHYLLKDETTYVTGQVFHINGGLY